MSVLFYFLLSSLFFISHNSLTKAHKNHHTSPFFMRIIMPFHTYRHQASYYFASYSCNTSTPFIHHTIFKPWCVCKAVRLFNGGSKGKMLATNSQLVTSQVRSSLESTCLNHFVLAEALDKALSCLQCCSVSLLMPSLGICRKNLWV